MSYHVESKLRVGVDLIEISLYGALCVFFAHVGYWGFALWAGCIFSVSVLLFVWKARLDISYSAMERRERRITERVEALERQIAFERGRL